MTAVKQKQRNGTSDRLVRAGSRYHAEAKKCLRGKAYLAAVVMQVSVLEAQLQAMCSIYLSDVKRTAVYKSKRFRRKRDRTLEFTLNELIKIARELKWFPPKQIRWAGKQADVAGFVHEIRKVRNLVHPSVMAKGRSEPMKFSKAVWEVVYEIFDVANSWLTHHVHQRLAKAMAREEMRKKTQFRISATQSGPS